jgi:hypothetical protein
MLKSFCCCCFLHLEDEKILYILNHKFLDHLKWTKNEKDMGFENKKG